LRGRERCGAETVRKGAGGLTDPMLKKRLWRLSALLTVKRPVAESRVAPVADW
jgi:hypothetical protein